MNAPHRRAIGGAAPEVRELPLIEAEVVPMVFVNGGTIKVCEGNLVFIGWQDCPEFSERRVVTRLVVPMGAAKDFVLQAQTLLGNGRH